ncbi:MAG: DNA repair protein RecO [Deltaproteobacteria bacterium]|nr:DNA repair protein RecO [Deltaproteobacteria bacterium]
MDHFSTKAIVLRVRDTGASDVLATLLTPRNGRLVCAARNARKSFKRFSGCLNLFSEIDAVVAASEGRDVMRIESAALLDPFEGLRRNRVFAIASAGIELVDRISRGAEEAPAVYSETRGFLAALSSAGCGKTGESEDRRTQRSALTGFSLRILALSGFRPEFDHCVSCGRDATTKGVTRTFDLHRGGLVCPKCVGSARTHARGHVSLSAAARAALKEMLGARVRPSASAAAQQSGVSLQPSWSAECARLVDALVVERLGSPLRSWSAV